MTEAETHPIDGLAAEILRSPVTHFFGADDGTHGREHWKTDGTAAGTVMVKDIYSGLKSGYLNFDEDNFFAESTNMAAAGKIYFNAFHPDTGVELWSSDGSEKGTQLVEDLYPGAKGSAPYGFTVWKGELYMMADHPAYGIELWALPLAP